MVKNNRIILPSNIKKIYFSNLLTGLIFWYGIEKLFLKEINIGAAEIGLAAAVIVVLRLVLDIPSGILADRWSRKGVLIIATVGMAVCSLLFGLSDGLILYLLASAAFAVYVVGKSGTVQAIIYDSLHEERLTKYYSRTVGAALGLFLLGCAAADIVSGFIAQATDYRFTFFLTIVPCVINIFIVASIKEPTFHKAEQKEKALKQLSQAFRAASKIALLRGLGIMMTAFAVIELYKENFGQLYFMQYTTSPQVIGLLWAGFATSWAIGSFIAHRLHGRIGILVVASVLPLAGMSLVDHWLVAGLYFVQAIASAALLNQIETRVQDATPSSVRASILSVLSALGQVICIPLGIGLGWLIRAYDIRAALYSVTVLGLGILLYWIWLRWRLARAVAL